MKDHNNIIKVTIKINFGDERINEYKDVSFQTDSLGKGPSPFTAVAIYFPEIKMPFEYVTKHHFEGYDSARIELIGDKKVEDGLKDGRAWHLYLNEKRMTEKEEVFYNIKSGDVLEYKYEKFS